MKLVLGRLDLIVNANTTNECDHEISHACVVSACSFKLVLLWHAVAHNELIRSIEPHVLIVDRSLDLCMAGTSKLLARTVVS